MLFWKQNATGATEPKDEMLKTGSTVRPRPIKGAGAIKKSALALPLLFTPGVVSLAAPIPMQPHKFNFNLGGSGNDKHAAAPPKKFTFADIFGAGIVVDQITPAQISVAEAYNTVENLEKYGPKPGEIYEEGVPSLKAVKYKSILIEGKKTRANIKSDIAKLVAEGGDANVPAELNEALEVITTALEERGVVFDDDVQVTEAQDEPAMNNKDDSEDED